jgi:hypothetical protein
MYDRNTPHLLYSRQVEHHTAAGMLASFPTSLHDSSLLVSESFNVAHRLVQESKKQEQLSGQTLGSQKEWEGVAATLALRAPKWFHRRYTTMIMNVLENTPDTWAVQIFVQPEWWKSEVLMRHRGLHQLLQHPRIILTELPLEFWKYKPKQIFIQRWFWEQMATDHVFLFSGNGVMCSHSIISIRVFDGMAFCGAPGRGNKPGGYGDTHSIRNRMAMLDAIDCGKPGLDVSSETLFFTSTLLELNKKDPGKYHLCEKNDTILFAGGAQLITENSEIRENFEQFGPSLVMSGTGNNLPWDVRDVLLQVCPEWKLIFPSLHEPSCFGATPVAEKCSASICALKPDKARQGC